MSEASLVLLQRALTLVRSGLAAREVLEQLSPQTSDVFPNHRLQL